MFKLSYCERFDIFIEKLGEYIQEKSASRIDSFLNRNKTDWKHEIPENMVSLAICTTTMRNKLEINESPVVTLKILHKYGFILSENKCQSFRMLLYTLYTMNDDDPLFKISIDIMEYFLSTYTNIDIQYFDCHDLDQDESILMVSCAKDVDKSIFLSFKKINEIRKRKFEILQLFLFNICKIEKPFNKIIAEYNWANYNFKYDSKNYNEITGEYLY